ncbi:hypothetical protein HAX54_002177 [Datura stramonium]|uniref:Uncharacterized protein n=1 Tax=Datura stramonium TaxID=4076 RepID=A0ABS8WT94_DATST|nr:hypothetical protein [Datura stramonium]
MRYVVLISQLYLKLGVLLFPDLHGSAAMGVITINKRRNADAPQNKRKRLQVWETTKGSTSHGIYETPVAPDLNMPNRKMSGHASRVAPPHMSSPLPSSSKPNLLSSFVVASSNFLRSWLNALVRLLVE